MFSLPKFANFDRSNNMTMYMFISNSIKQSILDKEMSPGEKLPSKRTLAVKLGVSVKTIENAYEQLFMEGYIYSEEKKGFYVSTLEHLPSTGQKGHFEYSTKFSQKEYKVNLRANRNAPEGFPVNLWCKLTRETLTNEYDNLLHTVPFNGLFELRKAIADHLKACRGMAVSPDQIIIGAGTEYMYSRLSHILGVDTNYALPEPCSKRLREVYMNNRLNYKIISSSKDGFDIDGLRNSNCSIIHLSPAHQYPLGKVLPMEDRIALLEWAGRKPDRYIIEDDFDCEFAIHEKIVPTIYSLDVQDRVIYMNTFSKSVSPAVRISYMVLPELLVEKYIETISFYSCTAGCLDQYTLTKFIERGHLDRLINRTQKRDRQMRKVLLEKLGQLESEGILRVDSECASAQVLVILSTNKSDDEIKASLKQSGIITSMMSEYFSCPEHKEAHRGVIVVNYSGLSEDQMDYLCKGLREIG